MSSVSGKSDFEDIEIEDYGDDVSIIDRSEIVDWSTIFIKVGLGLFFIGFVTACIIYSVLNSEEYIHPNGTNTTTYFLFDLSQHCPVGKLTWTNRTGTVNDYDTIAVGMSWIQDKTRQRIFHRIGIEQDDADWQESNYVFRNHTFVVTKAGCTRLTYGYTEFLRRLGLQHIRKIRTESFSMENNQNVKVNYFEGEPAKDVVIEGMRPGLVRAFSAPDNSFDYGWEYIFTQSTDDTGLFQKEYWFPAMTAGDTDYSVFENVPDSCYEKQVTQPM